MEAVVVLSNKADARMVSRGNVQGISSIGSEPCVIYCRVLLSAGQGLLIELPKKDFNSIEIGWSVEHRCKS